MNRISSYQWLFVGLLLFAQAWPTRAETAPKREAITLADIESGAAKFDGQIREATIENEDSPKEELFRKYGTRTFATFEKHPELVAALRKLDAKFDPHTMASSSLSSIATIHGKTLLILIGCFPHNCGGTHQVVAFDPATQRVYLLRPTNLGPDTEPSGKFYVYGSPDDPIRAAMYKAYPR
jgi:hypothetical protein